jgi:hypothetical protein
MKRPRQGIRSMRRVLPPMMTHKPHQVPPIKPTEHNNIKLIPLDDVDSDYNFGVDRPMTHAAVIKADKDSKTNIFCFAAFADKHTGIIYTDLTGTFPFMSLKRNVCFLIVYHYELNAILALPITNFSNNCILAAYTQQYELLKSKGSTMKLNLKDNQASQIITQFLTTKKCNNLLVEPNNHRVNAAEQAIQTFKVPFISALATTDSKFPLQLWDRLTPQVETTLIMLHQSQFDPTMLADEALHDPYDWNRFPLAPPGCKAVIYKARESQGSVASRGTDAWYVGPSMNNYHCNHFFVPKTQAYHVSG